MGMPSSGGVRAAHGSGLPGCGGQALQQWTQQLQLPGFRAPAQQWRCCLGLGAPRHWDHPGPGIELMSPALAGGFLTTGPPGKFKKSESNVEG